MPASLICMSHGGLMNVESLLNADDLSAVNAELARLRDVAQGIAPDVIVQFGNDHNSGFSLKLMPAFLIGLRATTLGDFDTSAQDVLVDEARGRALVRHLHDAGVDVATSYAALFDHGFAMALDKLFGGVDRVPVIPVFTNCGGDLRPPLHRSVALGAAIGNFFAQHFPELNVLYLGSGGLSHDPPLPEYETSPADVQQRMINGVQWDAEGLANRTRWVTEAGAEHGRGEGNLRPLNPDWDDAMMTCFAERNLEVIASQSDSEVIDRGGRGGSEIRNWLSAFAALRAHGDGCYVAQQSFYIPLPSWIVGFATMTASVKQMQQREVA